MSFLDFRLFVCAFVPFQLFNNLIHLCVFALGRPSFTAARVHSLFIFFSFKYISFFRSLTLSRRGRQTHPFYLLFFSLFPFFPFRLSVCFSLVFLASLRPLKRLSRFHAPHSSIPNKHISFSVSLSLPSGPLPFRDLTNFSFFLSVPYVVVPLSFSFPPFFFLSFFLIIIVHFPLWLPPSFRPRLIILPSLCRARPQLIEAVVLCPVPPTSWRNIRRKPRTKSTRRSPVVSPARRRTCGSASASCKAP